jgi:hypothetical protein|uniref:Uncharacterized protein n=1 Tax=Desulfotignum phosphitoxidans TaxID=190898 RepID=A7UH58_9BACT|nr:unknown [Desulfotignum phosphitoxidans DSM 13687]
MQQKIGVSYLVFFPDVPFLESFWSTSLGNKEEKLSGIQDYLFLIFSVAQRRNNMISNRFLKKR